VRRGNIYEQGESGRGEGRKQTDVPIWGSGIHGILQCTILTLVSTTSEVRELLSDFSLIRCDLLALGLSKVAEGICPHPEALVCVNNTSPQDQFITKGGCPISPNETPELGG
jgi:hypothetical protein